MAIPIWVRRVACIEQSVAEGFDLPWAAPTQIQRLAPLPVDIVSKDILCGSGRQIKIRKVMHLHPSVEKIVRAEVQHGQVFIDVNGRRVPSGRCYLYDSPYTN